MNDTVVDIPLENIIPDPKNLRQTIDETEIDTLAENIKIHGQMDPIQIFIKSDGKYDLLDGERRWRAMRKLGFKTIKALIVDRPSDKELLLKKISRVMQTKTLTFPEEIKALETGLKALDCINNEKKWAEAAKLMGVKLTVLRERMRISKLAPKLRDQFEKGYLDYTIAHNLGKILDQKRQEETAKFIKDQSLSNRFVTTKFMETLLQYPNKSLWEIYDIAREREKFRYAKPRAEEIPENIVDKLDDILADFRKCENWLEAIHRENFVSELSESKFNLKRFAEGVYRLKGILEAFVKKYEKGNYLNVVLDSQKLIKQ